MKKARILYGMIVLFTLSAMIYSQYRYFIALLIIEAIFPVLLYMLLKYDLNHISIHYLGDSNGWVDEDIHLYLEVISTTLFAIGSVEFNIAYHNIVFDDCLTFHYHQNLNRHSTQIPCSFKAKLCGDVTMTCKEVYFYDLFGLCRIRFPFSQRQNMTIIPEKLKIDMTRKKDLSYFKEGNHDYLLQKGFDMSDIYDLRNYHDGDDIRHIHWKLSAKMQQMLLKEGSHNSSINTVMLVDIGLYQHQKKLDPVKLSHALSYAMSLSETLIQQGLPHYIVVSHSEKMSWIPVLGIDDLNYARTLWLCSPLQKNNRTTLPLFLSEQYELPFSKMLYFTVGDFISDINVVSQDMDLTAITVKDSIDDVKSLKKGTVQFIELPSSHLTQNIYHFDI